MKVLFAGRPLAAWLACAAWLGAMTGGCAKERPAYVPAGDLARMVQSPAPDVRVIVHPPVSVSGPLECTISYDSGSGSMFGEPAGAGVNGAVLAKLAYDDERGRKETTVALPLKPGQNQMVFAAVTWRYWGHSARLVVRRRGESQPVIDVTIAPASDRDSLLKVVHRWPRIDYLPQ